MTKRHFRVQLYVSGHKHIKWPKIRNATAEIFPFKGWNVGKVTSAEGFGDLEGDETEGAFADRLTLSIWEANCKRCEVEIFMTPLSSTPVNFKFDKNSPLAKKKKATVA
jgi:hypothetical protein